MQSSERAGERLRSTVLYRFLYIVVLAFGGVGLLVFGTAEYLNWGWAPPGSLDAGIWLALAVLAAIAYLGFLLFLPPTRAPPRGA